MDFPEFSGCKILSLTFGECLRLPGLTKEKDRKSLTYANVFLLNPTNSVLAILQNYIIWESQMVISWPFWMILFILWEDICECYDMCSYDMHGQSCVYIFVWRFIYIFEAKRMWIFVYLFAALSEIDRYIDTRTLNYSPLDQKIIT